MKTNYKDLTGQKFGRLTALRVEQTNTRKTYWLCQCDCGNTKVVRSDSLQSGAIRSCGCLKKEQDKRNLADNHTHGMSRTRPYEIWQGMKARCYNPNDEKYCRYGGRGITVCDEWRDDFSAFYGWAIENGYSDNLTIDRIDNDKGYSPDNCRWANNKTQSRNRSTNIRYTIGSETKTLTEWCEIFGVDYRAVVGRYHRGFYKNADDLFRPVRSYRQYRGNR